jgi:hypothetical protein
MHSDNLSICIRDSKTKKPFREFSHDKRLDVSSSNLVIPFNTEYEFKFKVLDLYRRRIEIDIDGSPVVSGIVLNSGETVLERFQDSDRRFKFVRALNAAVADPTDPNNGNIVVRVYREKPYFMSNTVVETTHWNNHRPYGPVYPANPVSPANPIYPANPYTPYSLNDSPMSWGIEHSILRGTAGNLSASCGPVSSANYCQQVGPVVPVEAGATVEGSKSAQSFDSTNWIGDDFGSQEFRYHISGKPEAGSNGFCSDCGTALHTKAKFCHLCGKRIPRSLI